MNGTERIIYVQFTGNFQLVPRSVAVHVSYFRQLMNFSFNTATLCILYDSISVELAVVCYNVRAHFESRLGEV